MNAFADHFLEDSFSAGHIRTPRRALQGTVNFFYDLNAKVSVPLQFFAISCKLLMLSIDLIKLIDEEDGAIGLKVKNKRGDQWTAYEIGVS